MDVLVVTVVHTPLDARIHAREITALLDAGHRVTYAAPFSAYGVARHEVDPRLVTIDLPRARGRRRIAALAGAARLLSACRVNTDVVLLHDPELLVAASLARRNIPVIWDVHEDLASSLGDKPWVPPSARPLLRYIVRRIERWAERRHNLVFAEQGYAERFRSRHPVVPNYPPLPPPPRGPIEDRVVYLGRVSRLRGADELVAVGRRLREDGVTVQVVGPVDDEVCGEMQAAANAGAIDLLGFLPNAQAMRMLDGALAGLSLLHDHPNYRHSLPTKVLEYQASGVPVITTPLPAAVGVIESSGSGTIVPFGDVEAVVAAVRRLRSDRGLANSQSDAGRRDALIGRSWQAVRDEFVAVVVGVASS